MIIRKIAVALTITLGLVALGPATQASAATTYCVNGSRARTGEIEISDNLWVSPPSFFTAEGDDVIYRCLLSKNGSKKQGIDAVIQLQKTISYCYGISLAIDGSFGPATQKALKAVQKRLKVQQDGVYGPVTGAKMNWISEWYGDKNHDDGSTAGCFGVPKAFG